MDSLTECPKCHTDVMVTGFTLESRVTETFMRFDRGGLVRIASTKLGAEAAYCMCCNERLKAKPVDLMRAA